MPKVIFKKSGAMRTATVDGSELDFVGGVASKTLQPGESIVHWFARGDAGDAYGLAVTLAIDQSTIKAKNGTLKSQKAGGLMTLDL